MFENSIPELLYNTRNTYATILNQHFIKELDACIKNKTSIYKLTEELIEPSLNEAVINDQLDWELYETFERKYLVN